MKTPLLIALTAGLSMALSSGAIQIYQGSARNTAKPTTGGKTNNYKATIYVVHNDVTNDCTVYEAFQSSELGVPTVQVKKKFTKRANGVGSFVPAVWGDYKTVQFLAQARWASPFTSVDWYYGTRKKNAAYKFSKESGFDNVGPTLYDWRDNGGSLKENKGLTKDAGATMATGEAAVEAHLAKKKLTAL